MKLLLSLAILVSACQAIYAQTGNEKTLTYGLSVDTLLKPDYFTVRITVAEYVRYEGHGRRAKGTLVPLDTIAEKLVNDLGKLGFRQPLKKLAIAEKDEQYQRYSGTFNGKVMYQVSYECTITNRDSIEYLFRQIDKNNLQALIVTPMMYDTSEQSVKDKLTETKLQALKIYVQKLAAANDQKVIRSSNTYLSFNKIYNPYKISHDIYGHEKAFVIDIGDLLYSFNISYTYVLADT